MAIPATIHQLWKTADAPARFTALRESWRRHHPTWEIRLWTDADLEALVASRYPALLGIYRAYAEPICRADLGRYLVLETFGGVYADLDCECLRPLDPLLNGEELVIGLEPESHLQEAVVAESGLDRLLCPTLIASRPGHPLWAHVRRHIAQAASLEGPLNKTGPFMLTRAFDDYSGPARVTLLPSPVLYPFSKAQCWSGEVYDLEVFERCSRDAYAAHYWDGGWFRDPGPLDGLPWTLKGRVSGEAGHVAYPDDPSEVRITCLTLADGDDLAPAIESYLRQTHANKELVIVHGAAQPPLAAHLSGRDDIRVVAADSAMTRAERRTAGAGAARGSVVCRWDAGELQDPRRLEIQLRALMRTGAQASLLARRLIWRPATRQMAIAADQPELATLICQKTSWPMADDDADAIESIFAGLRVTVVDLPRISLKLAGPTFEADWPAASARFEADRCDGVAAEVAKRLPLALLEPAGRPKRAPHPSPIGEILVLTPIKDGRSRLPRYFELASRLQTNEAPLSIAFLEGDSRDGSFEALEAALPSLERRFCRIEAYRQPDGLDLGGPRWLPDLQFARRAAIARARNRLLHAALGGADWVLWLDVDLIDYPPDLALRLLAAGKDIVTPHCTLPDRRSFDLNTFAFTNGGDDPADLRDGIYQPVRGKGRRYLEDVADQDLVKVDSVGGTALLVRGDLHRQGLDFPAESYGGYIETEGLAMKARDMGVGCWALPKVRIVHPYDAAPA